MLFVDAFSWNANHQVFVRLTQVLRFYFSSYTTSQQDSSPAASNR